MGKYDALFEDAPDAPSGGGSKYAALFDEPAAPTAPGPGIGLSGPGSQDPEPEGIRTTGELKTGYRGQVAEMPLVTSPVEGAKGAVKSIGTGLATLSGEASPLGPEGIRVPFSGLMEGSKRREFERGLSDVTTLGAAEGLANLIPDYKARSGWDALAAPDYRNAGGVAGMALPNPIGEAVNVAGKAGEAAISRTGEALQGIGEKSIARSDKRLHEVLREGGTPKQRAKLDEVAQADVDMVRKTPALKKAMGNAEDFHAAIEETLKPLEAGQKQTLARAQMVAGKMPASTIEQALTEARAKLGGEYASQEVADAFDQHIKKAAGWAQEGKGVSLEDLRAEKSRLQKIAFDKGPTAKTTEAQEAAGLAAGVIKDALEKHIDTALPGEGKVFAQRATDESVLLRMKAIAARNVDKPRKPTGYLATMARRFVQSPVGATLSAVPTGIKYGFRNADEALAGLARAVRKGGPTPDDLIQQVLAAGVKPSTVDAVMARAEKQAVPEAIDPEATATIPTERMSDIVPRGEGGVDAAAGQEARAALPDDTEFLDKTQRIQVGR